VTVDLSNPIVERAVVLAVDGTGRDAALGDLIRLAQDQPAALGDAQAILVGRIRLRSDDHAATGGLTLVNAALGRLGWPGQYTWKPRGQK
jgi:hypothetical protein